MRLLQAWIFLLSIYFLFFKTSGLKCILKGMVDNRVQCVLHDRGINSQEAAAFRTGDKWLRNLRDEEKEALEPWKYTTGLDCNRSFFNGEGGNNFQKFVRESLPATRWCGDFDMRTELTPEDLVLFIKTDKCCKIHKECVVVIEPRHGKYDLQNRCLLTRFHCECEKEFLQCLKDARNNLANKVGFTYFTLLGPQCFNEDHPIINCTKKKVQRCLQYKYNRSLESVYQWFDVPMY